MRRSTVVTVLVLLVVYLGSYVIIRQMNLKKVPLYGNALFVKRDTFSEFALSTFHAPVLWCDKQMTGLKVHYVLNIGAIVE